jgi:hypothetical protein
MNLHCTNLSATSAIPAVYTVFSSLALTTQPLHVSLNRHDWRQIKISHRGHGPLKIASFPKWIKDDEDECDMVTGGWQKRATNPGHDVTARSLMVSVHMEDCCRPHPYCCRAGPMRKKQNPTLRDAANPPDCCFSTKLGVSHALEDLTMLLLRPENVQLEERFHGLEAVVRSLT